MYTSAEKSLFLTVVLEANLEAALLCLPARLA
jgi:hypothetical protein